MTPEPNQATPLPETGTTRMATHTPGRGRRRWLFGLAAAGLTVLLTLALAEGALRMAGFSYEFLPRQVVFGWPDPVAMQALYQPDRDLLWVVNDYDRRLTAARAAEPLDLIYMGDSCTEFCRFDEQLDARIAARNPEDAFQWVNLAAGGWTSYQGAQQMRRDIVPLRPRAVAIYYGWNDHWMGFGFEDAAIGRMHRSPFFALRGVRLIQLLERAAAGRHLSQPEAHPMRVPPPAFRANLEAMVDLARANGILPVLLTAPAAHESGREPPYLAERQTGYFTGDGIHLTPAGGALVAQCLDETLSAHGLFRSPPVPIS